MSSQHQRPAPDPELADLVRRDVFGDTTDEEAAHLRSDDMCERWLVDLQRVCMSVHAQLENLAHGVGPERDAQWRSRATHLWSKYNQRSEEAKRIVGDFRARMRSGDTYALEGEIARLRGAVRGHQRAVLDAGAEPEEWDELLWSHLARPAHTSKGAAA